RASMNVVRPTDLLTVSDVAERSGFAPSALRFYEREGLLHATRTTGNQRRYERSVLRRLAFIRAARNVGLSLDEVTAALATLPESRTPTRADWTRLSQNWRQRLDDQIAALSRLRDGLDSCIGCGCLSLRKCAISNPADIAATAGPGANYLPAPLRRGASA
ncbi:MAG: redox-sensitive transcriptional activator SoxR, partial [Jatrophihabitans sp.]|nr:redox-sensitive transcriptional activator SoxR [Jatrophihabitans sp.]